MYHCIKNGGVYIMKYEWKKNEKELYNVKKVPRLITVPAQNYIMISGKGNPNDVDFSDRVGALYSLAYAIKMGYKSASIKEPFYDKIQDYTVYPLEGIWKQKEDLELVKEKLEYTIMIRQPNFITKDMVQSALELVKKKKPTRLLDEIQFHTIQEKVCVEILHIGPFDDEPESFEKMDQFVAENSLRRIEGFHQEIYLNNAKRVPKSKLKTILRYQVTE